MSIGEDNLVVASLTLRLSSSSLASPREAFVKISESKMADSGHHIRDVNIRMAKNDHLPQRGIPAPVLSEEEWKEVEQRFASLGLSASTQSLVQYAKEKATEEHYLNQVVDEAARAGQSLAGGTTTKTTATASTSTSSFDKAKRLTDATVLLALH